MRCIALLVVFALSSGCATSAACAQRRFGRRGAKSASDFDEGRSLGWSGRAFPKGEESPELQELREAEADLFADLDTQAKGRNSSASGAPPAWLGESPSQPDLPFRWNREVLRFLEFFRSDATGKKLLAGWVQRGGEYEEMIRRKFRAAGLPQDLFYVAMIESGFDPTARSQAGALGMWQFTDSAATEYGLARDHWVDERRDPEKATAAAARYLRDLHRRFGTWELALAAYNMGYVALLRAIRKYNSNDYWTLAQVEAGLPFETRIYVAKILAAAMAGRNRARFDLPSPKAPTATEQVQITGSVPLASIARAANLSPEELNHHNPELLRQRTPPRQGGYALRLPASHAAIFSRHWRSRRGREAKQKTHVLRLGESLEDIAKRAQISVTRLKELNHIGEHDIVGPGSTLILPDHVHALDEETPSSEDALAVAVLPRQFHYRDRKRVFYRVIGHESLRDVAKGFGVRSRELAEWNALDPRASLQPGMVLQAFVRSEHDLRRMRVLDEKEVKLLEMGSEAFFAHHEAEKGRERQRYIVQKYDTLNSIAKRFSLSVGDLARINQFPRNTILRTGQEIIVYVPQGTMSAESEDKAPLSSTISDDYARDEK